MSNANNKKFLGLTIPLAAHSSASSEAVQLSDRDITRMEGISPLYRAMRSTFGDTLGAPCLVGAEIRMAMVTQEGAIPYSPSQVLSDLMATAEQLKANAKREQPLPHRQALNHQGLGKVLDALSTAFRKAGTRLIACTEEGDCEVAILEPGDFIEPVREDRCRQTGTFKVVGIYRDDEGGRWGLFLTRSFVLLELQAGGRDWCWSMIEDVLRMPTCLVGTISRATRAGAWTPEDGARLVAQELLLPECEA